MRLALSRGYSKVDCSTRKSTILKYAKEYIKLLGIGWKKFKVTINVQQVLCNDDEMYGLTEVEIIRNTPIGKKINIRLACLDRSTQFMMKVLAHEFIHVKQLVNEQLVYTPCHVRWKKKLYKGTTYAAQPWEVEAFAREKELYESAKARIVNKNKRVDNS